MVVTSVKGDKSESDSTIGESHLLNMPLHILESIMELCIGVEYMKFRATCKYFHLAAPPIKWSNKTTLRRLQKYSVVSPWLMVLDNYRDTIIFIDPLLVVPYLEIFCFSAPPTSPDCMVVGFTTRAPWNVYIHFVSGESTWHTYDLNFGGDDLYSYRFPAFNGRDIYALCNDERVKACRDMTDDDFSWEVIVNKTPRSRCRSPMQYFLSNCDQHLLLVIISEFGESIEVFKLNESTEEWEKIDEFGKHMIYISDTSCIRLEAKSPEMGNKIYFPRLLHDENTKIVFYSLETCKYRTFDDKNIQESFGADLFGTKHHSYPHTWIEPSWS
ncbi:hypothetical protein L1987_84180 [Smallanthus sonchifolius]|uniref:Uncharacterized protein n=1 Tax=Smallanthus sonchifolius TaxID=185202 RepID=A0ACB8YEY2_9ASTR|nr:hypothetical protein L1987_84180 [Smallanthus sonchifolius]